ncbi:hypothetical protein OG216_09925 [Streptomycetaceae bacterium NBC_01309]
MTALELIGLVVAGYVVVALLLGYSGRNGRLHGSAERRALKQHDAEVRRENKAKRGARRG